MAAVFRQVELVLVGEPGELRGKLVLLAIGRDDRHREAVVERARDDAFDAADMIDIGDDLFARLADPVGAEGDIARRHVGDLARMLGAVFQHEAAIDFHADALKIPPLRPGRRMLDRR